MARNTDQPIILNLQPKRRMRIRKSKPAGLHLAVDQTSVEKHSSSREKPPLSPQPLYFALSHGCCSSRLACSPSQHAVHLHRQACSRLKLVTIIGLPVALAVTAPSWSQRAEPCNKFHELSPVFRGSSAKLAPNGLSNVLLCTTTSTTRASRTPVCKYVSVSMPPNLTRQESNFRRLLALHSKNPDSLINSQENLPHMVKPRGNIWDPRLSETPTHESKGF